MHMQGKSNRGLAVYVNLKMAMSGVLRFWLSLENSSFFSPCDSQCHKWGM